MYSRSQAKLSVNRDAAVKISRRSRNNKVDCSESDSEAECENRSVLRRSCIRPDRYDGSTTTFATFKVHFVNAAEFNGWSDREQLAHLKASLTGAASQCLWDQSPDSTNSLEKLWKLLCDRFGNENLIEKHRTELRTRRRKSGESLSVLCQDIRRLLILSYPGPTSSAHEAIAKDSFIDALDVDLSMKVRERDPTSLDEALRIAMRLEAIHQAATTRDAIEDVSHRRGKQARGVVAGNDQSAITAVLAKLNELQRRFDSELKSLNWRMSDFEAAAKQPRPQNEVRTTSGNVPVRSQSTDLNVPTAAPSSSRPQRHGSSAGTPAANYGRPIPTSAATQRVCYRCGDPSHLMRHCPVPRQSVHGPSGDTSADSAATRDANTADTGPDARQAEASSRGSRGLDNGQVYLVVRVNNRRHLALVDSGCELSLAPNNMIDMNRLRPTTQNVFAANGTPIKVVGEADIYMDVNGTQMSARVLVSPDVSELMLGITWLEEKRVVWNFSERVLIVDGMSIPLQSRSSAKMCRRVYVQDATVLAPRTQVDVPVRSTLNNIRGSESDNWLLEARQLRPGLMLARTVLPDQHRGIVVRVINTTSEPQEVPQEFCLGNLEPVEVCSDVDARAASVSTENPVSETDEPAAVDPVAELVQSLPSELTDEQRCTVEELLRSYEDVFSKGEFDVGCTHLISHRIDTGQHRPVRQPLRRHPTAYLQAIDEYVERLQENNIIEPSAGPWASNIVVVRKKDGRLRLCVDYRAVNSRTYHDSYPLPNVEATFDALSGASWFCTLDLRAGYHNIPVAEEDRDKTQFVTRRGTWRWRLMPFGLSTAPGTFQRLMDLVMSGLTYDSVLVYLDDLIIIGSSFDQLVERLEVVLARLRAANLKLNYRKCELFKRKVYFLGHVVSGAGVEVQPEKVDAVNDWPTPTKVSELRSFLGLASYYRRFIDSFSVIAAPLYQLMRKDSRFTWRDEQQLAFEQLKVALTTSPVLGCPQSEGTFCLDTDASERGLGAVLSQEQGGNERVLAYASRTLSAAERNYSITRKELLAVIFGLKKFRPYLIGRRFTVRTDHAALKWLRQTPEPMAQAGRWLAVMEEFDFDVQHRAGSRHLNADALSRRPHEVNEDDSTTVVSGAEIRVVRRGLTADPNYGVRSSMPASVNAVNDDSENKEWTVRSFAEIAELQQNDVDVGPIVRMRLQSADQPPFDAIRSESKNTKIYWAQWPRLVIRDGVVYRVSFDKVGRPNGLQLLTPTSLRCEIIDCVHTGLTGSHIGVARTMAQLSRRSWWTGWRADVRRQLKRCSRCSRYFRGTLPRQGQLQPTRVGDVFERLSIDLTGPHPKSRRGHVYILTVVDPFSKWCECIALRNKEATTIARALVEHVFCRLGCPLALLSDRGGKVDGQLMREVCRLLQIDKLRTSSYHPSCNAACERLHRTLNSLLGKVVSEKQVDWDDHLPYVAAALRASPSEATGYSANYLVFGREVNTPADIVYGLAQPEPVASYDEFVEGMRRKFVFAYDAAREQLRVAAARNKKYYDLKAKPKTFADNDLVYYYNPRKCVGRSDKWATKSTGPFRVVTMLSPVNVLFRSRYTLSLS